MHAWHDVTPGINLPEEFLAVIEIPSGSSVNYELGGRMNRTERDFRRELTRRVRAAVQALPETNAEWQRRRLSLRRLLVIGGAPSFFISVARSPPSL